MAQSVANPQPMRGKADVRSYLQGWFTAFPDLNATVRNRVVTEDQVAAEVEFTGTNSGPMQMAPGAPTIPATGKKVMGKGTYFVRIRNGKGVEVHIYPESRWRRADDAARAGSAAGWVITESPAP